MAGTIRTYQKCRICGKPYPSSAGVVPIECCQTYPTKFYIRIKRDSFYRNADGKALRDWWTAQQCLYEMRSRVTAGTFEPEVYKRQSKTSFQAFWLQFAARHKKSPATYDKLTAIMGHLSLWAEKQMRDIKPHMVDEWWVNLDLSPSYKNDILTWFKSFMKYAWDLGVIEKPPIPPTVKPVPVPKKSIEFYTEDEQLQILGHIPEYDKGIVDFLFLTGVRVNEACALYRADVNWDKGVIEIQRTVKRNKTIGMVKNKKVRVIPLAPEIRNCLTTGKVVKLCEFQFVNKWGRRYSADYLRSIVKKAATACGFKNIPLKNATRHSFGMGMLEKGYDAWQTSKAMNHASVRMTENYVEYRQASISKMYGRKRGGGYKVVTNDK